MDFVAASRCKSIERSLSIISHHVLICLIGVTHLQDEHNASAWRRYTTLKRTQEYNILCNFNLNTRISACTPTHILTTHLLSPPIKNLLSPYPTHLHTHHRQGGGFLGWVFGRCPWVHSYSFLFFFYIITVESKIEVK